MRIRAIIENSVATQYPRYFKNRVKQNRVKQGIPVQQEVVVKKRPTLPYNLYIFTCHIENFVFYCFEIIHCPLKTALYGNSQTLQAFRSQTKKRPNCQTSTTVTPNRHLSKIPIICRFIQIRVSSLLLEKNKPQEIQIFEFCRAKL